MHNMFKIWKKILTNNTAFYYCCRNKSKHLYNNSIYYECHKWLRNELNDNVMHDLSHRFD